jgi:uncharacterized protein YqjF (DUF2071 family)
MSGAGFLEASTRQAGLALDASERPWPLPEEPWAQAETREGLLAHWRVDADELARMVAPELEVERFDGAVWLGIACLRVRNLRLRGLPPLPGLSTLLALEVRTYVTDGERPGIWLLSLDATNRLLVEAAKRRHRLPAYHARIELEGTWREQALEAERDGLGLSARWTVSGPDAAALPGSLARFACERYALYTADGGRLYRAELHHAPTRVRPAQAQLGASTLVPVDLEGAPEAFATEPQDLLVWPLVEL